MSSAILELILKAKNEAGGVFGEVAGSLGLVGGAGKTATKDVEGLAGAGGSKTGLGALTGALGSLISPVGLAVAGIGALGAVGAAAMDTYDKVETQTKALDTALQTHNMTLSAEQSMIEGSRAKYEALGFTLSDVRPAFTAMTEAGLTYAQQQAAIGPIMDLARAKNMSLADATDAYSKMILGGSKALLDYGIKLGTVTEGQKAIDAAQQAVDTSTTNLAKAKSALTLEEEKLAGRTHLTAAEQAALKAAQDKVTTASDTLAGKTAALTKLQDDGGIKAQRLAAMNDAITGSVGGQASSIGGLAPKMATLNDKWEDFATAIGPGVQTILGTLLDAFTNILDIIENVVGAITGFFSDSPTAKTTLAAKAYMGAASTTPVNTVGGIAQGGNKAAGSGGMAGFASGGVVPGAVGAPMVAIVHGGETITPAGRAAGGVNLNVTISGAAVFDPYGSAAQQVAQALLPGLQREMSRQGISIR